MDTFEQTICKGRQCEEVHILCCLMDLKYFCWKKKTICLTACSWLQCINYVLQVVDNTVSQREEMQSSQHFFFHPILLENHFSLFFLGRGFTSHVEDVFKTLHFTKIDK